MKLYELCDKMKIGNINVLERNTSTGLAYRKFSHPANSSLKKDYYYADVVYFTVKDSSINVIVKRSTENV